MAKKEEGAEENGSKKNGLVAKLRFDDQTKKCPDSGVSLTYNIGEPYKGEAGQAKKLVADGLLCKPEELVATKEVIDKKDKIIADLREEVHQKQVQIDALGVEIAGLKDKK